ncbi:hypothetical protein ACLOJK_030404 [Asimina triloba]
MHRNAHKRLRQCDIEKDHLAPFMGDADWDRSKLQCGGVNCPDRAVHSLLQSTSGYDLTGGVGASFVGMYIYKMAPDRSRA